MVARPFTVLMVCMGNICRSPMAERLLQLRLSERLGDDAADLVVVHGAGTGAWHEGEPMHEQSAQEVLTRGGDPAGFQARALTAEMLGDWSLTPDAFFAAEAAEDSLAVEAAADSYRPEDVEPGDVEEIAAEAPGSDLILTASIEQVEFVVDLVPAASHRTFVLGEFARLAEQVDPASLPPAGASRKAVAARGRALVAAANRLRDGARFADQVPDPWGRAPEYFTAVADQIDAAVSVLADRLV
jgi:protein-tyrosine phosphatase